MKCFLHAEILPTASSDEAEGRSELGGGKDHEREERDKRRNEFRTVTLQNLTESHPEKDSKDKC